MLIEGRHTRCAVTGARLVSPLALAAALLVGTLSGSSPAVAAGVVGTGTAASCTADALNLAIAGGGLVTFNCGTAPVTIDMTPVGGVGILTNTTIDGSGSAITITNTSNDIFIVDSSTATFVMQNLTLSIGGVAVNGIDNFGGTVVVRNCTLTGTSELFHGDIFSNNSGTLVVTNSTIITNINGNIGGILNDGTATLTNTTGSDQSLLHGSAQASIPSSAALIAQRGGAPSADGGESAAASPSTTFINSIISVVPGHGCTAGVTDGGHNVQFGDNSCGGSIPVVDPKLDPAGLASNGGPTQTIALQAGSPAIDAGDETVCAAATGLAAVDNLDQRGFGRPGAGSTHCSIGAFEYNGTAPVQSPTPSATFTAAIATPSPADTATRTRTATNTPTATSTQTLFTTNTATRTPTQTATNTSTPTLIPTSTPATQCTGDCSGDRQVTVDEILTMVNMALGNGGSCPEGIASGTIPDVSLIVQAVNNALNGCGVG